MHLKKIPYTCSILNMTSNNTLLLLNFETTSTSSNQVIDSSDFQNHGNVNGEINYTPRN